MRTLFRRGNGCIEAGLVRSRTTFCNPPFSATLIEKFVEKAVAAAEKGSTVVLLLPSWPGYDWFQELKQKGQMQDVIGPLVFENADGSTTVLNNGYHTSSIVIVTLGPGVVGGTNGPPIRKPGAGESTPRSIPKGNGQTSARRRALFTRLSDLTPQSVECLWEPRFPLGEITNVEGDPGCNKSSLLLDLAARVSTGRSMPDGTSGIDGGVLLLAGEDSVRKTVIGRL
ncbi:MAG: AAA family ATPase, partial [Planctomycetes bacterium]|nr:AAA family ATPase [Planctomycetota bacterium]